MDPRVYTHCSSRPSWKKVRWSRSPCRNNVLPVKAGTPRSGSQFVRGSHRQDLASVTKTTTTSLDGVAVSHRIGSSSSGRTARIRLLRRIQSEKAIAVARVVGSTPHTADITMPETNYVHKHVPGNFMDVLKNVVYIAVVKAFQKDHPEGVILVETHSGPVRAVWDGDCNEL